MTLHPVIEEFIFKGGSVSIDKNGYHIDGFYKSGAITLKEENNILKAYSRYDQVDEIHDFDDLVALNYFWWDRSKGRSTGWSSPDSIWEKHLIESGRIKKAEKVIIEYETT